MWSVIVCAKTLREYTPGTGDCEWPVIIDPKFPHEYGEYQDDNGPVDNPCNCKPVKISWVDHERRKASVLRRLGVAA